MRGSRFAPAGRGSSRNRRSAAPIPAPGAAGVRIIAHKAIPAHRKTVTSACYAGSISRKRKLLDTQNAGKKKMRQLGRVDFPEEAFVNALKMND